MSVLAEVAAYLAAAPYSLGVLGTDLFLGAMPETPPACCALYEYGGVASEQGFDTPGVQYETPGVQVVFRGAPHDYGNPRSKAETAYRALAKIQATTLSGTLYHFCEVRPPFLMRRDESQRVYVALNALCRKEPSAA